MKKLLFIIGLVVAIVFMLMSFIDPPQKLKVEMTQQEWVTHLTRMNDLRNYLDKSNLPHRDVIQMEADLDNLCLEVSKQLAAQLKDSAAVKKK